LPLWRYAINLLVFLFCYYWILEIFRSLNRRYQSQIEQKNADLALSRQQLDEEHRKLAARTEELQMANAAKERLFSIIAHDLRGPIGNLKTSVDFLADGHFEASDLPAILTKLKPEVEHAYECLDTLLAWSASQLRGIQPLFAKVSLAEAAGSCAELFNEASARRGIAIRNSIPAEAEAWADKNQVAAIFRNLVSNALKFTPAGGGIELAARKEDGFWRVIVTDTGVGMPEERARHLFEPHQATSTRGIHRERGLGLGLQICREFVEANGGTLCVESREGQGSAFQFTLREKGDSPPG